MTVKELIKLQEKTDQDIPRTMIFINRYAIQSLTDKVPIQMQLFWNKNAILPEHLVFLTVETLKKPHADKRFLVQQLTPTDQKTGTITSIIVQYGFMENPDLEPLIKRFIANKDIPSNDPVDHWVMQVLHEKLIPPTCNSFFCALRFKLYSLMHKLIDSSDYYFGLGENIHLTVDILPVMLK
jgi:KUP system potassium uptake protein